MTFEERVAALAPLGFPPRQTAFLVAVALHGGYCLRRQFDAFAGRAHGQVGRNYFDRLVRQGLAAPVVYQPNRGSIFHLHAKRLYRALDQDDNRNRRAVSPALIARKLMVLDYVLTTPMGEWLATEHDKVAWFTARHRIGHADLPQRRYEPRSTGPGTVRYFIHKLPIRIVPASETVEFAYLVEDETGRHFEQFLDDHLRLLSRLSRWRIVLVYPPHLKNGAAECERAFSRSFAAAELPAAEGRADVAWFFRARAAVDRGDLRDFSVADLDRYRELRGHLTTASVERLYVDWQRKGDAVLSEVTRVAPAEDRSKRLVIHELPWRYAQFGKLPGAA